MSGRGFTGLFILTVVVIVGMYDSFAEWKFGPSGTITGVITSLLPAWPVLAFIAGFLCGHLFFQPALETAKGAYRAVIRRRSDKPV